MDSNNLITADQASQLLRTYLVAKDENRPHCMTQAFDKEAVVEMVLHTGAISFPARMDGIDAVTDALVRNFGRSYENVYSFYLDKPDGKSTSNAFSCDWMVVMSEKSSGSARVGCGRYDWEFGLRDNWLVRRLRITIAAMQVLPPESLPDILNWTRGLSYPWSDNELALARMPLRPDLDPVRKYMSRHAADQR